MGLNQSGKKGLDPVHPTGSVGQLGQLGSSLSLEDPDHHQLRGGTYRWMVVACVCRKGRCQLSRWIAALSLT